MRKYLFLLLLAAATQARAQFDTSAISQKALAGEDTLISLFKKKDWVRYANLMHPSIIKIAGGKENFVVMMKQVMKTLDAAKLDVFQSGRVLQIVKVNHQYQCVLESFMQMNFAGTLVSGSSYDLAISDNGGKWTYLRIDKTPATIRQMIPELSADLKFPKSQMRQGTTLDEFMKTYTVEYLD